MLEPVFITLVVIFVVYLLYQRKKRKEQQMGEELDDLIKANDWQGVSRILRKQLIIWGLLAVTTGRGSAVYCANNLSSGDSSLS